jgi:hypothetical protein
MQPNSFEDLIDAASEKCGGQNALARQLGMTPGNLSAAKHAKKAMPKLKLRALADFLQVEEYAVWKLYDDANQARRYSFPSGPNGTLSAWALGALMLVTLSVPADDAKASIGAASQPVSNIATKDTLWRTPRLHSTL